MPIRALNRKLLREIGRLKGQVATIALVLAGGITCYIALRGTYAALASARETYYERFRFAHVFASLEPAPESVARRIEALPDVTTVQTRIAKDVTLPIEGMPQPAYGRILSLPASGIPSTNGLYLYAGRLPERAETDAIALLRSFADAHGLRPGDGLPAVINGKLKTLRIVGLVLSPEFVYAIRPGALVDDPKRYAAVWMQRSALATAFGLEGAFNDVTLRLRPGANEVATTAALDRILVPYGGNGAYTRHDQLSNRILTQELDQLRALAGMVPLVFLGVAAFLINMVLGRMIRLQRPEIAALKAVGYTNREIAIHYLGWVVVVLVPGFALGILGGSALGHPVLDLYRGIFRFPELEFALSLRLTGSALVVSGLAATAGALVAVRAATKLPPAEAMRPPAPAQYRRNIVERLGLGALAGPTGMMVLREIQVHPLRTASSAVGIAGAVALMILGHFGLDSLDSYLEGTYAREQRQDLSVALVRPVSMRAVGELARLPGVRRAEGLRVVPARVSFGHRKRDSALMGLPDAALLRRLVERGGREVPLPSDGVLVTKALGRILDLHVGDRIDIEVREGDRRIVRPVIAGFVDETTGLFVYARASQVAELIQDSGAISLIAVKADPNALPAIEARLRRSPKVIDVSELKADVQRLRDMNGAAMDVWTLVSISLSVCIVFGVVYNNARIALAARSRDLASLRVLGFSRAEISSILIGGLAIEVALAIPIGLVLGRYWAMWFMSTVDQETFRLSVSIAPRTYVLAAMVALLAAAASALWVRRSLDHLDLIGVLKTRE